jgi:hypothetical protein
MKNFSCSACGNKVYFENVTCVRCGHALGFDAEAQVVVALKSDPFDGALYRSFTGSGGDMRYCANAFYGVCN